MKIILTTVIFILTFFSAPHFSTARSSDDTHALVSQYFRELKSTSHDSAAYFPIYKLVTKLAKLDPKKGKLYLRIGLSRLTPGIRAAKEDYLAHAVERILLKAGLPPKGPIIN